MKLKTYLDRGHRAASSESRGIFENAMCASRDLYPVVQICPLLGVLCLILTCAARADEPIVFKTNKALQTALSARMSWSSVGAELGDQLRDLQNQSEIAILRDRRIDPHRLVSVKTDLVPRIQVLREMSSTIPDGAFCMTENFAFVGSASAVHRLPILLDRNNTAINERQKKFGSVSIRKLTGHADASWDELAEPRQILFDHAKSVGVVLRNPEAVPHDVWAARRMPRMSFVELATVILNQFDQTIQFADDRPDVTIIPIDDQESVEHRYVVGSKLKAPVTAAWQSEVPDLNVRWSGSAAIVTTTLPQHVVLSAMLQELEYSSDSTSTARGSIRTNNYQIKADRATIGQVIDFFRREKVPIEVIDESSPETQAVLGEILQLDNITEKQPGSKLFPRIFGDHFKSVDVRDDRVVLSLK
ncbi:MAG TPA: hypothetical protein PLY87_15310 [Planctomycetaceae bacterium]|nr:hypothetical protein [Planctomycetaceae bacterium]HQZ66457.1 hypothetical protein [Planctomycetaceae bacterium]HRA87568.1 hypothetical protein [Planctomycetaceae bacterium]